VPWSQGRPSGTRGFCGLPERQTSISWPHSRRRLVLRGSVGREGAPGPAQPLVRELLTQDTSRYGFSITLMARSSFLSKMA
jgi:hypothetical protein